MNNCECCAEIFKLIEDEAEAIAGYYEFLNIFKKDLNTEEKSIIFDIIEEERQHIEDLKRLYIEIKRYS